MKSRVARRDPASANLPDPGLLLELFEQMVLLRRFETVAQGACRRGETPGFLHLYIGEEATGVGVCAHLRRTDWVTSTHRGHGHALAKGADPRQVMAELFGKSEGLCGGRGGTMHLYDRSVGLFGTNGIVGAGIGHAVGVGLAARRKGTDDLGVAFFGDGGSNHGAFHEALNFAAVQRAQTVFVCENNLYATATPLKSVTLNPEIADAGGGLRDAGGRRRRQRRLRGVAGDEGGVRAGALGGRADADRGQDLPHRRPPRGRPGGRHLPDPGGDRRLGQARPDRDVPPAGGRGVRRRHGGRARGDRGADPGGGRRRLGVRPVLAGAGSGDRAPPRLCRSDQPARGAAAA